LLVHPSDSTVVYATPPLADAISWPWINLIGMSLENLIDDGKMPSKPGETVRLRILEQTGSPSKNAAHLTNHNRPTTPLRSPSHSPNSTVSNSTNSGGDQASSLWSPHLYRSSNNGISSAASGAQFPTSTGCGKTVPYLLCSCFAILRVPITRSEEMRQSSSADRNSTATSPSTHLNLYLLQPTPNLCLLKDNSENASTCSLLGLSQLGKATSSIPLSMSSPASTSSFHRSKERYFLNRQRRLLMQNPPSNPASEDEIVTPRHLFCTVLDQNLNVKWIENSGNIKASIFSSMTGQSFLDFVSLDDLQTVSKLLTECKSHIMSYPIIRNDTIYLFQMAGVLIVIISPLAD
uniref:DEAD domain-containing protein n=1 Tax=Rodentolepis nana TaxID=102285 RepID=A0A0R3TZI2_RODNA